jgi:hypothetical protein
MTVLSMLNVDVLRQMAQEREAALRRTNLLVGRRHSNRRVRRWVGRQLVRVGTRLANEPTMRPVRAR